jgi:phospho-2-dehydro-3-deoxyheptonate aldolase
MVAKESQLGHESRSYIEQTVMYHYMLDPLTAHEMATTMPTEGLEMVKELVADVESEPEVLLKRDENREEVIKILNRESDKQLIIIGPCSLDLEADYTELFDYIQQLQKDHPDAVIAWRGNGAKPRSGTGSTGLHANTDEGSRKRLKEIYMDAFKRGIPIFTEITEKDQFSDLAPYLTAAWLGARDMGSTELRKVFSATRMAVFVKNGEAGGIKSLWDAIDTLRSNTKDNKGSGVNLGYIASTCRHKDGGPASFNVGDGNPNVAVIARGYELDKENFTGEEETSGDIEMVSDLTEEEREELTYEHLGKICMLAAKVDCAVILDGSHKVPNMLSLKKDNEHRFLGVLKKFRKAAKEGRIMNFKHIRGYLGEVSVSHGKTDKNLVLTTETKKEIDNEIKEHRKLITVAPAT